MVDDTESDDDADLYVFSYQFDEEEFGSLDPVEDDDELAMLNAVIDDFLKEENEEE